MPELFPDLIDELLFRRQVQAVPTGKYPGLCYVERSLIFCIRCQQKLVMTPAQLCPQCRHNWECFVKLTIPVQLPHRKTIPEFRLQLFGKITDEILTVFRSFPALLLFFENAAPDMPVHKCSPVIHHTRCLLPALQDNGPYIGRKIRVDKQVQIRDLI